MLKKQLQVGFIGAGGFISAHHLLSAERSSLTRVRAIADISDAILQKHQAHCPMDYVTKNYQDLLNDEEIDLIVIGTRQDLHAGMIVESLKAGKWVLCEKPMANTKEEASMVLQAESGAAGRLAIGFNRRFAPAYRKAKALMHDVPRPWMINYRMMNFSSHMLDSFYSHEPRILYEGCHILDLISWFMDDYPSEVYMVGDYLHNNTCILYFEDGSQIQFMCGSMGALSFWKENMEIFGYDKSICINDFVDMRIRGFENEHDRLFGVYQGEHDSEIFRYGFDFYDLYRAERSEEYIAPEYRIDWDALNVCHPPVKRGYQVPFNIGDYQREDMELRSFVPNKGWYESFEHFAGCQLKNEKPDNADGRAGAASTVMAECLLESLKTRRPVQFKTRFAEYMEKALRQQW